MAETDAEIILLLALTNKIQQNYSILAQRKRKGESNQCVGTTMVNGACRKGSLFEYI